MIWFTKKYGRACIRVVNPTRALNLSKGDSKFKPALQLIESFRQSEIFFEEYDGYLAFLQAIVHKQIDNRPVPLEPRMAKRRPKAFPRSL